MSLLNRFPGETTVVTQCGDCGADITGASCGELCPQCLLRAGADFLLQTQAQEDVMESTRQTPTLRRIGKFDLLEEIARGGMGIVYRARQIDLDRIVALKLLLFGEFSSDEFVQRFRSEAAAVAVLQHPNIVAIHEVGQHNGQHYFSMEYVAGPNLAEVARERPMPANEAAECVRAIADAVHFAHKKGILHRDLKPSNVLLDPSGKPRLTDFGLAKRFDQSSELTVTGHVLGSPNYMPPEQAAPDRGPVGPCSDIYSLGAILYFLLTSRPPAVAETLEATLLAVLKDEPVSPRLLNRSVPRDLETICLKCLAKNPSQRYASAEALADDLGRFLRHEPIVARPATPVEKFFQWCRRKPAAASAVALLALITCGSVVIAAHLSRLHRTARQDNYRSEISRANQEWKEGHFAEALFYLQRQVPRAGEADLRGFEWRHLWRLAQGNCSSHLPFHEDVVSWLGFSPDGKMLATFGWDRKVPLQVWDVETQRKVWSISNATSVAGFSPDGKAFVASGGNGDIAIHDAKSGRPLALLRDAGSIVSFAPSAYRIVTMDPNRVLRIRQLPDGGTLLSMTNHARRFLDAGRNAPAAISPDGQWLAVVRPGDPGNSSDSGIDLWKVATQSRVKFLPGARQVRVLQFSPDSQSLATGDKSGGVQLWRWNVDETRSLQAHELPVQSIAFSADGRTFATGASDERVRLWNTRSLAPEPGEVRGQAGIAWSLAFSPRERLLASGGRDMPINLWKLDEIRGATQITNLNSEKVGNFAFSPNSRLMAAGCKDNRVRVWDVETAAEDYQLRGASYVVAFTSDNRRLLVANERGDAWWWDYSANTRKAVPGYAALGEITCVEIAPDRRMVGIGHKRGTIQLLEIHSGKILGTYQGHHDAVLALAFTPDGRAFASGSRDKQIRLWSQGETNESRQVCAEHKGAVVSLGISSDGRMMASGCSANAIKFWDLRNPQQSLGARNWHRSPIRTLTFSPDSQRVVSGSEDRTVKIWDFGTRRELAHFDFDSAIRLTAFSPDGNHLAVVTDGGSLHLLSASSLAEADRAWRALFASE